MSAALKKRELPAKEAALFKQILRQYEHKQYKKGLKVAEQILKKFPEHGETLAMKGLFLSHLSAASGGGKEEAYEFVKKGLKCDLFSAVCWHVYGLLYRSDKNYEEAMKCYRYALKYDNENLQVLRDFSFLQIQMRDYEGFNETKHELLRLRPGQRVHWIGLTISYHLLKKYDIALQILEAYEDTLKDKENNADFPVDSEHSELLLYKNQIKEESGDLEGALKQLDEIESRCLDKRGLVTRRAEFLLKLGKLQEAEVVYRSLIQINPESVAYYTGLFACAGIPAEASKLTEQDRSKALQMLAELKKTYPRSNMLKRLELNYSQGPAFAKMINEYIEPMLRKGVPSLFTNIKGLLADPTKRLAIVQLLETYLRNLRAYGNLNSSGEDKEPPSTILWVLYFLSQLRDYEGKHTEALILLDEAIEHTPTLLELVMFKARVYKHAGNPAVASVLMNEARLLDLQDRFINSKSTKYHLRADQIDVAENTIGLFAKIGDHAEKMRDLIEMQCMWFALEAGESWMRQEDTGRALKCFHQIFKHFEEITDDQFDFHTYCLRKLTIRPYLSLLRFEDRLYSQANYKRAARNAIRCYTMLHDDPSLKTKTALSAAAAGLSEAERKKLLSKQKKAAAREAAKEVDKKSSTAVKDEDPTGQKLAGTQDPLGEAMKFLRPLQSHAFQDVNTHLLGFEIYIRQKKFLLAFKCLKHAMEMDSSSARFHEILIHFWHDFFSSEQDSDGDVVHPLSREIILASKPKEFHDLATLARFNESVFEASIAKDRVSITISAVTCQAKFFSSSAPSSTAAADQAVLTKMWSRLLAASPPPGTSAPPPLVQQLTLSEATRLMATTTSAHHHHHHHHDGGAPLALRSILQAQCHARFPLCVAFMTEEQKKQNQALVESLRSHYPSGPNDEQDNDDNDGAGGADEQKEPTTEVNNTNNNSSSNNHNHYQDITVVATEAMEAMCI